MKNFQSGLIIFFFIVSAAYSQNSRKSDLQEMGASGNVNELHETFYKALKSPEGYKEGKKISNSYDFETKIVFDESGFKIEETRFNAESKPSVSLKYRYDERHYCIEESRFYSDGRLARKNNFSNIYDQSGRINITKSINEKGDSVTIKYLYDKAGMMVEKNWLKSDGSLDWKVTNLFDEKGNAIETTEWGRDGNKAWVTNYKYNDSGKVIEETLYKKSTKFIIKYKTEYDSNGNKIKINWCKENGKVYATWTYQYTYDAKQNWIRAIVLNSDRMGLFSGRDEYIIRHEIVYF